MFVVISRCRHDDWNGIQGLNPLKVENGGTMHPTDMKLVGTQPSYTAGGNASWVNPFWTSATVPVIESAVTFLAAGKFREPTALSMTVAVSTKSDPNNQAHRMGSLLRRISPEEEHIAFVLATYRDVAKGESIQEIQNLDFSFKLLACRRCHI